jgi:hypothetical protein
MEEWTEMFAKDPDLGIMEQQYMRLKTQSLLWVDWTERTGLIRR